MNSPHRRDVTLAYSPEFGVDMELRFVGDNPNPTFWVVGGDGRQVEVDTGGILDGLAQLVSNAQEHVWTVKAALDAEKRRSEREAQLDNPDTAPLHATLVEGPGDDG